MYFKRKRDLSPSGDGTLLMHGEWYDSEADANDEETRPWLLGQVRLPVTDPALATVELVEDAIAKQAEELAPIRAAQLAPVALDETLPDDVKAAFGRNRVVNTRSIRDRARIRRDAKGKGVRQ